MEPRIAVDDLRWSIRLRSRLRLIRRRMRATFPMEEGDRTAITRSLTARWALWGAIALYMIVFIRWALLAHYGFETYGFDLAIFDQGIWLLSRFEEPFVTVLGLNLFGDHTSFLLLLLVPFYWLVPSASILLSAQAIALGAAAFPAFLIAREKLRNEIAASLVAIAYLFHPAVGLTNLENFHPDSFEVPLVMGAIYFMLKERWRFYWICIVGALLVKEDVPLLTFMLGLYIALKHDRRVGISTSVLSVGLFALNVYVILPAFNDIGTLDAWRLPTQRFGGFGGLVKTALLRPWEIMGAALGPDRPFYLWQLLIPFLLLPLAAPLVFIIAIGPLLSNLLSTFWYQYNIAYHYTTLIIPVLVTATAFAISRFRSERARVILSMMVLISAIISGWLWGPIGRRGKTVGDPSSSRSAAIRSAIEVVPVDASVSAIHYAVPHLTYREDIYEFPNPWRAQNWADGSRDGERLPVADEIEYVVIPNEMEPDLERIVDDLQSSDYSTIHHERGFTVLRKET
jgi:uncharacterized membrane protein